MPDLRHCPTCGAPLRIPNRFVKVVTCEFCGSVALYDGARLDPTGRSVDVALPPSPLYLDATGQIAGRTFRVLGRLVYEYDGGLWTEWFLDVEDAGRAWLVEDEGTFTIYQLQEADVPPFASVRVGQTVSIGEREVYVNEVGEATVVGTEGSFGVPILPGETIRYVDGVAGTTQVSVEYAEAVTEVFVGKAVPREALVLDDETYA